MVETAILSELQIRRRELENELASLSTKELTIKGDLQKLEEEIIAELEETIEDKKLTLNGLESQKNDLEKKLRELQGKRGNAQTPERSFAGDETVELVLQGPGE